MEDRSGMYVPPEQRIAELERELAEWKQRWKNLRDDCAVGVSARPEGGLISDEIVETLKRLRSQIPGCDCDNPSQCWEPCGTLGHSEKHMKVVKE